MRRPRTTARICASSPPTARRWPTRSSSGTRAASHRYGSASRRSRATRTRTASGCTTAMRPLEPAADPAGVWDGNFVGVWHLNEEQAGTGTAGVYQDSTANGNDGIDRVAATGQEGQVTDGQQLGANDWIEIDARREPRPQGLHDDLVLDQADLGFRHVQPRGREGPVGLQRLLLLRWRQRHQRPDLLPERPGGHRHPRQRADRRRVAARRRELHQQRRRHRHRAAVPERRRDRDRQLHQRRRGRQHRATRDRAFAIRATISTASSTRSRSRTPTAPPTGSRPTTRRRRISSAPSSYSSAASRRHPPWAAS